MSAGGRCPIALEDALQALTADPNQQINWAIGEPLQERAKRPDWRDCPILQHLETGAQNLGAWNELFRRTRKALTDENDLPKKACSLLSPQNPSFDSALDDFIAEMLAAQYLAHLGHENVRFTVEGDAITADLTSLHEEINYVCEAKNLREPNSLTYVAFARWHRNRAANPDTFNFVAEFLHIDDPFEDLTAHQATAVRDLVDALPNRNRPSTFNVDLPGNRSLRVRVREGAGAMLRHGPGPFGVDDVVEECKREVLLKLLEPTRKALVQLYSTAVPPDYRRLLFVRWKPPDEAVAIGELENIRTPVLEAIQQFTRQFFPGLAIVICHTYEDIQQTPLAAWEQGG